MSAPSKVAIITGGASGLGLAVAKSLAAKNDWKVHILDSKVENGQKVEGLVATAHQVDVTDYSLLAEAFKNVFQVDHRVDFVFANAGIVGMNEFYNVHDTGSEPPPPFPSTVVDINLTSVINTSYLAQHYFRQTPQDGLGPRSLIITSSTGGIYGAKLAPTYAAAKFGTIGFMRSIAPELWKKEGVRVNAILPGTVRTRLLPDQMWSMFPEDIFTPMEKIVQVVQMLLGEGEEHEDGTAVKSKEGPYIGQAVEVNVLNHYFRDQHTFSDDVIAGLYSQ